MYPRFDSNPVDFDNSKAVFRMMVLATVLQRDIGVSYHPGLVNRDDFFADAQNLFVHGVTQLRNGTCTSLPPLYVAIGRRLGYPLKLVSTKAHLFARWDGRGERINIECTARGFVSHSDEHYLTWPFPSTEEEAERFCFLQSKSPRQELAHFLANRGHCLLDNEYFEQAVEAYAWGCELDPENHLQSSSLVAAMNRWDRRLRRAWPAGRAVPSITAETKRFRIIPDDLQDGIATLKYMQAELANVKQADDELQAHDPLQPDMDNIEYHYEKDPSPW